NQLTLLSMDLDRPGVAPYVYDPSASAASATRYRMANGTPNPGAFKGVAQNPPIAFPALTAAVRASPPPPGSEFDANTGRAVRSALGRLTLSRSLTPCPAVDPKTGQSTDAATASLVATERATFAQQIFDALRAAVGADTPANVVANAANGAAGDEYRALR